MKVIKKRIGARQKLWEKAMCVLLSVIIGLGTIVSMTFGNIFLSDYIDFNNLITTYAAENTFEPVPMFYRHGELVGLYRVNYTDKTVLQYKIGENGEWTEYKVPFTIPAYKTTRVYARIGETGQATYKDFTTTNEAIGVYSESNTDFEFSYNNIDFGYTRIYNSADKDWFESIHSKVLVTNSRLEVTLPDGSKYPMIRKDNDTYVDELNGYTLTKTSSDYVFDDGQYKYYFAIKSLQSIAYLSAIEDYSGNKLDLSRTTNTEEISISDGAGRSFALSDFRAVEAPDGSGVNYYSQKEITDPNGNKIEYTTKFDRYIQIKDQAGVILGKYEYKSPTDYTLTKSTDKTIDYYDNGRLKQITYNNDSWIKYTYDDENMLYTTLTSSDETTKTVYNNAFMPVEYTDEYGTKTEYTYDEYYRVKTEKTEDETTTYAYDSKGNIVSYITGSDENDTYYTYDSKGNVIREKTGDSCTYYTYDSNKNVLINATLKEGYKGEIPEAYDADLTDCFDTTSYTYDEKGRVTKEESTNYTYEYEYDNSGNVLKETSIVTEDEKTQTTVTTYTYDDMGNVLTTQCDKDNESFIYDKAGRTLLSEENGKYTRTIYDEYGRTVQEIAPEDYDSAKDGLPQENTYADANVGQRYVYDDETGNLTTEINRLDVKTNYTYYSTGEKKQEAFDKYVYNYNKQGAVTTVKYGNQLYASYEYDENLNNTKVEFGNGQIVNYDYNEAGNLIACRRNNESKPYITMSYSKTEDDITYMSSKTDYDCGRVTSYDDVGNITSISTLDGEEIFTKSVTQIKDDEEELKETTFTQTLLGNTIDGKYTENYCEFSSNKSDYKLNITKEEQDGKTVQTAKYVLRNLVIETSEYEDGRLVKKTNSNGTYDPSYVETLEYDEQGRIIKAGKSNDQNNPRRFEYKDNRLVRDYNHNGGYVAEYKYDKRGNIISSSKYRCPETEEDEIDYSTVKESTSFNYGTTDDLSVTDSLIAMDDMDLDINIDYDVNGNPLNYVVQDYEYVKFEWTNGRQLKKMSICEDLENDVWTDIAEYTYDENGIKTSVKFEGKTKYFIYEGNTLLGQYTDDGEKISDRMMFIYDENGEIQGAQYSQGQNTTSLYYYQKDVFGNVGIIRNMNGDSIASYQYEAYGHDFAGTMGNEYFAQINPITYRCYYHDGYFGGYYNLSRYYHPIMGRFFNLDDPMIALQSKSDPDGMNLFAYCNNDPVNFVDSDGQKSTKKYKKYTYVFMYNGKSKLVEQAKNSYYYDYYSDSVKAFYVKKVEDFIKAWNSMTNIYDIYLYLHGGDGHLIFDGSSEELYVSYMDKRLIEKFISGSVYLFSCHGGGGANTYNVAYELSKKTKSSPVYAAKVGVSYSKKNNKYYARIQKKYYFSLAVNTYWYCFKSYKNKGKWCYSSSNLKMKNFY